MNHVDKFDCQAPTLPAILQSLSEHSLSPSEVDFCMDLLSEHDLSTNQKIVDAIRRICDVESIPQNVKEGLVWYSNSVHDLNTVHYVHTTPVEDTKLFSRVSWDLEYGESYSERGLSGGVSTEDKKLTDKTVNTFSTSFNTHLNLVLCLLFSLLMFSPLSAYPILEDILLNSSLPFPPGVGSDYERQIHELRSRHLFCGVMGDSIGGVMVTA
eukprot:TRINITY_DN9100_c0_g1_i2.p2 TRINITY_DN9100_c0_g1~~TRINITY_DN9100_c0_g1_i2.p2  ORF type:complete len:242 (-),score=25.58 TRINITY_DN9100_c0_g1_i2:1250-1885(-)